MARVAAESHAGGLLFAAIARSPLAMVVTDPTDGENRIVFTNLAFMRMTGHSPAEVIGARPSLLQGPHTDREAVAAIRAALHAGTGVAAELLNYRKDGTPFWNALSISPITDAAGRLCYYLGCQVDMTQLRHAEALRQRARTAALVSQITAGVAHDVNNLLTVIAGSVDMLETATEPQRRNRLAGRMREAVARAQRLTQELRSFASKLPLEQQAVDINALVERLGGRLTATLEAGTTLELRLDPRLSHCRGDPARIEAALLSLVANAREAMPDGGRLVLRTRRKSLPASAPAVTLEGLPPGDYAAVGVADTGHGMHPGVLRRAAEPFFTTKPGGHGSGLGLSTVHSFAQQSGGHLQLRSRAGYGTLARLLLPAHPGAGTDRLPTGKETVLLAQDEPHRQDAAMALLATLGYRVLLARSGEDALAVLDTGARIDLLLVDVGQAATAAAQEARQRHPGMAVLLASHGEDPPPEGIATLPTPYAPMDLAPRIRALLDARTAG